MIINPVNEEWLSGVLDGLGSTPDEVAATLRAAQVTGARRFGRRCPVAVYIGIKARERVPSALQVVVWISSEEATVRFHTASGEEAASVNASMPVAVAAFVDAFDGGGLYADLADADADADGTST